MIATTILRTSKTPANFQECEFHRSMGETKKSSGDDIGRDLVFDEGDAVAQLQFALLQPLQPQQIRRRRLMQSIDCRVEVAMLLLQTCELGLEFALIFVGHGVLGRNEG